MTSGNESAAQEVAKRFATGLSEHGYGFHYAVLAKAQHLEEAQRSQWVFEVSEFPVSIMDGDSRIDFILRHKNYPLLIVAECKRANPAYGDWCFIRAPYVRRNRAYDFISVERITFAANGARLVKLGGAAIPGTVRCYNVGLPLPTGRRGDSGGQPRRMIEDAATQVSTGVNGLAKTLALGDGVLVKSLVPPWFHEEGCLDLTGVVFTTARLWTTDTELSATNLETGNINVDQLTVAEQPFVAFQYHVSPGLWHGIHSPESTVQSSLGAMLDEQYMRTIWVVSVAGIEKFLGKDWY